MNVSTKLLIKCEEPEEKVHPHCPHGPTLLFHRGIEAFNSGYYGCSAHRDKKSCAFHLPANRISENLLQKRYSVDTKKLKQIRLLILQTEPDERNYCHTCDRPFTSSESSEHQHHQILNGISNEMIANPINFLKPLENDQIQAQYFFDEKCLEFFKDCFQRLNIRKLICIGAPRLHAYLRQHCYDTVKSFLLDYDQRFFYFYNENEYSWYNMCNNHFFDGESEAEFKKFLKIDKDENILIFTDPPFGCRTEPIAHTMKQIFRLYANLNNCTYRPLAVFWIFPYFAEHYIRQVMPEMEMSDYKVNYVNHSTYNDGNKGRKLGSPVRLFTNIPLEFIKLPSDGNYKYCKYCKYWTSIENLHCTICKKCPSKNGATYRHCIQCGMCVKPNYVHCSKCRRCTQRSMHQCNEYQKTIRCWICKKIGHNENLCMLKTKLRKTSVHKNQNQTILCLICVRPGHNEKNCPQRRQYLKEECFMDQTFIK